MAGQLGLDDYRADLLPQDKVDGLLSLKGEGKTVAFVGDGINDAPVLAASDVGVAMGFGTDAAIEAADVVLVSGKPSSLPGAVKLSRRVMNLSLIHIWSPPHWAPMAPAAWTKKKQAVQQAVSYTHLFARPRRAHPLGGRPARWGRRPPERLCRQHHAGAQ